jgi:hypothetical protein
MDGLKIALKSYVTAHKFLFWTIVALVARAWVELCTRSTGTRRRAASC